MPESAVSAEDEQFAARELPVEQNLHKCSAASPRWLRVGLGYLLILATMAATSELTSGGLHLAAFSAINAAVMDFRSPTALKSSGEAREVSVTLTLGNNHCGLRRRTIGIALRGDIPAQPIQPRFRQGSWSEIAK